MSENLDLVRSIYADWERGDYTSVAWAHPEIEFAIVDGPSPGRWTGVAEMSAGWTDFLSAWERHRAQAEAYREVDDDRVLVFGSASGRGKTSGMPLGSPFVSVATVFEIRDGKVTRIAIFFDRARALADLGLEE